MARRVWLECWVASYPGHDPWVLVVDDGAGGLAAAATLARRHRWPGTEISAIGSGVTGYVRLPSRDGQSATRLADGLAQRLDREKAPWRLSLPQLPLDDQVLEGLSARLPSARISMRGRSPRMRFDRGRSLRDYVSRNYRQHSKTLRNRLRRAGIDISVSHACGDKVDAVVLETERVRRARDAQLGRQCKLDDGRYLKFRRMVMHELAGRGEAEITELRIDGELAAYVIGLIDGRSYRMWDTKFSPRWGQYGVGTLVVEASLERALGDDAIEEYDFLRGILHYKMRLANDIVDSQTLLAWSSPMLRGVDGLGALVRHNTARSRRMAFRIRSKRRAGKPG